LILPTALPPHIGFLLNGFWAQRKLSMVSDTGLVTREGQVPLDRSRQIAREADFVDLKVNARELRDVEEVGLAQGARRASAAAAALVVSAVDTDAVSITSSTDPVFALRSRLNLPVVLSKRPCSMDTPK